MHGTVKWVDGVMTLAESGSGHSVVMDGPPELGGKNHGLRPMEMLLSERVVVHFSTSSLCSKVSASDFKLSS